MADEIHEARGVRWTYLDPDEVDVHLRRNAHECDGCGRWFEATVHARTGDDRWCPECEEVESISHSLDRVLEETPRRPAMVDVAELMDAGDPR